MNLLSILGQGWPVDVGLLLLIILVLLWIGLVVIGEDESGLLVRRYGRDLPPGRLIALDGEAGYQAKLLMPGWHFGYWPWKYKIVRVKMIVVRPEANTT